MKALTAQEKGGTGSSWLCLYPFLLKGTEAAIGRFTNLCSEWSRSPFSRIVRRNLVRRGGVALFISQRHRLVLTYQRPLALNELINPQCTKGWQRLRPSAATNSQNHIRRNPARSPIWSDPCPHRAVNPVVER